MNKIVYYFPNSDLRCSHDGLTIVAKREGKDPKTLNPGEFMVFVNTRKNMLKIFAARNVIAHYRQNGAIDLRILQHLPEVFNGGGFNYSAALRKVLERDFAKRGLRGAKQ